MNWNPKYFSCIETGLTACEIEPNVFVRVDGMVKRNSIRHNTKKGWHCGFKNSKGYYQLKDLLHRMIAKAFLPNFNARLQVDHVNGNRNDNRVQNLRMVSSRENNQNRKSHRSGALVGASLCKAKNKWQSYVYIDKKQTHLGFFDTAEQAHKAYLQALDGVK